MTRIFHWLFMWNMDPMSGFDIRLMFTLPPSDSTLQYKRCVHLWNNFPCIKSLSSTTLVCKDKRTRKSECLAKAQFLYAKINIFLQIPESKSSQEISRREQAGDRAQLKSCYTFKKLFMYQPRLYNKVAYSLSTPMYGKCRLLIKHTQIKSVYDVIYDIYPTYSA